MISVHRQTNKNGTLVNKSMAGAGTMGSLDQSTDRRNSFSMTMRSK